MRVITFLLIVCLAFSCSDYSDRIEGQYEGIFERNGETANVKLNFSNGAFSGESPENPGIFPSICKGDYSILRNSIEFKNECIWTAHFDWTLILSGEWEYDLNKNTLILTEENGDRYRLTKE